MKKQAVPNRKSKLVQPAQPVKIKQKTKLDQAWEWLSKQNYKLWFWVSFAICSLLCFYWASKSGINGDGPVEHLYGQQCVDYYLSGGEDTSCIAFNYEGAYFPNEKYYGAGFEGTFDLLQRWVKADNVFQFRLLYLTVWSISLLLFIALIAKEFARWKGALIALWITFLWPFILGQFFWNSKDIPQALGFAVTLYFFFRFSRLLPKISIKNLAGVALGIAIALSVRVGGALLAFYVGLFSVLACFMLPAAKNLFVQKNYKQISKIAIAVILSVTAGVFGGIIFYPNFFEHGLFEHLLSGTKAVTDFPQRIPQIFDGYVTDSLRIPWYFLAKMFYVTTPMLILVMLHLSVVVLLWKWRKTGALNVFILLFSIIFPFAYMMYTGAPVYNGWRHVLFAGITMPPIIAIGCKELIGALKPVSLKWFLLLIVLVFGVNLAVWNVRNAPYQLAYFNDTVGGTNGAFHKYEFDQLHIATSEGLQWLLDSVDHNEYSKEKPMIVAINLGVFVNTSYIPNKAWRGKVKLIDLAFRSYAQVECDYAIMTPMFTTPQILSYFWPPKGIVYERTVDGVTIMCVVDRRKDTDYKGIKALQSEDLTNGVKLLEEAYAYNPRNYTLYYWLGYGYYRTGNKKKSIEFLNAYKNFYSDREVFRVLGYSYYSDKQYNQAITNFNIAFSQDQNDLQVAYMIALCWFEQKNYAQAQTFLQQVLAKNPSFVNGQNLLRHIQSLNL